MEVARGSLEAALDARLEGRGGVHQRTQRQERVRGPPCRSVFAARMIEVCSWGGVSFPLLQWLSQGVLEDLRTAAGERRDDIESDIVRLASIGSSGEYANNTRRDMLRALCPHLAFPEPLKIRVPFVKQRGAYNVVSYTDSAVFMPNEQFDAMFHNYRSFFDTFVAIDLPTFWGGVSAGDPVAYNHPVFERHGYATSAVPYMVLGDKVQYTDAGESAHVIAWSPINSSGAAVWQQKPFACIVPSQLVFQNENTRGLHHVCVLGLSCFGFQSVG